MAASTEIIRGLFAAWLANDRSASRMGWRTIFAVRSGRAGKCTQSA
jgi:hypothetical protein